IVARQDNHHKTLQTERLQLFKVDYEKFCGILRRVKPDIPPNQATHILRHTFASHFMMNGGNIIALQQILGHASIQQTMAYAHLAPDYLQNAVALNPLKGGVTL
ncbi:tyrosine-type recombinase/integrase, partial [Escherichia marmotae]|uniref:tyrosine-type recombinase/integrase n=1 Tax=Escherichia marmotae TaxID=1499973 RepID=UPI002162FF0E